MNKVFNPFTGLLDYTISSISELTTKDHDLLSGLLDDDHTQYLLKDGTRALTGNWDAGAFSITAAEFISNVAIGTQPYACTSTTVNTNLNADMLDGKHVGDSGDVVPLLDGANLWSGSQDILEGSGMGFGNAYEVSIFYIGNVWNFYINEPTTEILFNSAQLDTDFRITGITDANLFFVDASTDNIGIGKNMPAAKLDIFGTLIVGEDGKGFDVTFYSTAKGQYLFWEGATGILKLYCSLISYEGAVFNENGNNYDFRVEGDTDAYLLMISASRDAIGIGIDRPTAYLHQKASTMAKATGRVPAGTAPALVTNEGDYWNDSTQKANMDFIAGIRQSRVGCIFTQTGAGTVGNTAAETTLVAAGIGTTILPANFFTVGKTVRITASGYYSTDATALQTLTMRVRFGGIAGTLILTTNSIASTSAMTNRGWRIIAEVTCSGIGTGGTVVAQGIFFKSTSTIAAAVCDMVTAGVSIILNTTIAQQIVVSADWNSASASDTITCSNLMIEVLN
jgi:hypothetical protein